MSKEIILVRTGKGSTYGDFIRHELGLLGIKNRQLTFEQLVNEVEQQKSDPRNTILHFRTAGPNIIAFARRCNELGYRVINSPDALENSNNKLQTVLRLEDHGIRVSRSREFPKSVDREALRTHWDDARFVIKSRVGIGQGAYCFRSFAGDPELQKKIRNVPGEMLMFQELVDYERIFRVTVINGQAMHLAVFMDEPTESRWKVSVCLNDEMQLVQHPDPALLDYACRVADACSTEIGFIDVFQDKSGYVLSEINTACSLIRHERLSRFNIAKEIAGYLHSQLGPV